MTELLILAILLNGEFTIYKIKQKIENNFSVFLSASFGSIHPAIKKLEKNGFISAKRKMSGGGQKSSLYSITTEGKEHFKNLMTSEIIESPACSNQLINIKMMLLGLLDENLRKDTINLIKKYYEIHLLTAEELLETLKDSSVKEKEQNYFQITHLKNYTNNISFELNRIQGLNLRQ
ncbi:MAG TPA: hypothetical protein DDW90_09770 [Cyanobacteria bacterium UBA9971]|nr:hypothetical protein [Cyanobacteria bacterium UBA9971]